MSFKALPVAIVGAGISGLAAAQVLLEARIPFQIFDKARGLGGRLATRRLAFPWNDMEHAVSLDHGAQFISAFQPAFRAQVDLWLERGLLIPYFERRSAWRYQCPQGMNALAKDFSITLGLEKQVARESQVHLIESTEQGIRLEFLKHSAQVTPSSCYSQVILTAPVPQALELIDRSLASRPTFPDEIHNSITPLRTLTYDPCFAGLFVVKRESLTEAFSKVLQRFKEQEGFEERGVIWLSSVRDRGGELPDGVEAFTVHMSASWTQTHWEVQDPSQGADLLFQQVMALGLIHPQSSLQSSVLAHSVQKWRYSAPRALFDSPYFEVPFAVPHREYHSQGTSIWLCGDAFQGPRVEGAFLSGRATAQAVIERFKGGR